MRFDLRMPDLGRLKPKRPRGGGRQLTVPAPVRDLYADLRDRRLLPLMAFLLVAILAVPFLLGGKDEIAPPPPPAAAAEAADEGETLTVVRATPGLRDYKQRLRGRKPKDPFNQQYTGVPAGARLQVTAGGGGGGGGGGAGLPVGEADLPPLPESPEPPRSGPRPGGSGKNGSGRPGGPGDGPRGDLYAYRPTVRFGIAGSNDLGTHSELPVGTLLPGKRPVVVFLGISDDGKRATFSVSREVAFVRGDGRCIGGPKDCGLLMLREGEAVDLLTGKPNRDFRLKVMKIEFVKLEQMTKANSSRVKTDPNLGLSQSFSK